MENVDIATNKMININNLRRTINENFNRYQETTGNTANIIGLEKHFHLTIDDINRYMVADLSIPMYKYARFIAYQKQQLKAVGYYKPVVKHPILKKIASIF